MCYPQALGLTLLYPIYWVLSCIFWKSLSCFWYWLCSEQFLQYLYLPQDCMQFTAEPRTHSPMSQILNLNWKNKNAFEFQEESKNACHAMTLWGIFSRSSWSTYSYVSGEKQGGITAGRAKHRSGPSWGITFLCQGCLWEQESGLCGPGGRSRPTFPWRTRELAPLLLTAICSEPWPVLLFQDRACNPQTHMTKWAIGWI